MHGHSHEEGRTLRVDGSRATLLGKFSFSRTYLGIHPHGTGRVKRIDFPSEVEESSGHGGGDAGVMRRFIQTLNSPNRNLSAGREALESHLMAFAADEARLGKTVVAMEDFRTEAGIQ
jgi:hypothetical protein